MIEANELRTGNWVSQDDREYQCGGATILDVEQGYIQVSGIPLTEEWLVKFGFVQVDNVLTALLYKGDFGIEKDGGAWSWSFRQAHIELGRKTSTFYHHILQIQYVHQIQNLVFALTGEELTIKQ